MEGRWRLSARARGGMPRELCGAAVLFARASICACGGQHNAPFRASITILIPSAATRRSEPGLKRELPGESRDMPGLSSRRPRALSCHTRFWRSPLNLYARSVISPKFWPPIFRGSSLAITMLDSYVDQLDDVANGDHSYISHYGDSDTAVQRLCEVVDRTARKTRDLHNGHRHATLVGLHGCDVSVQGQRLHARDACRDASDGQRRRFPDAPAAAVAAYLARRLIYSAPRSDGHRRGRHLRARCRQGCRCHAPRRRL